MDRRIVVDQMGSQVEIKFPPQRIVSLVPSQTELLHSLGLEKEVIGITKFCVHPPHWRNEKRIVGGTKKLNPETIDDLKPDLIIGNKEENEKTVVELLKQKYPVWMSDVVTLEDAYQMIQMLGELCDRQDRAYQIVDQVKGAFANLSKSAGSVLYLIWMNPWMAAASGTFIHAMLSVIGLVNVLASQSRYPELTQPIMKTLHPDYVFLSSEPYPFEQKHIDSIQSIFPQAKVILVNGEYFSWYGSRLIKAPDYFNSLELT